MSKNAFIAEVISGNILNALKREPIIDAAWLTMNFKERDRLHDVIRNAVNKELKKERSFLEMGAERMNLDTE